MSYLLAHAAFALVLGAATPLPPLPPLKLESVALLASQPRTVGGGEVFIEVSVDVSGSVSKTRALRATPPFTSMLRAAVSRWRFSQAPRGRRVLVAAVFRPPNVVDGGSLGTPPEDVGAASPDIPYPGMAVLPAYPPNAQGDAQVVVAAEVNGAGAVVTARVVASTPGFDAAALAAARAWTFRVPRHRGVGARVPVFLVFGFRQPVAGPSPG